MLSILLIGLLLLTGLLPAQTSFEEQQDNYSRVHQARINKERQIDERGKYIFQNETISYLYPWYADYDLKNALINRIGVPAGYKRTSVLSNDYADWLRNIPLKINHPAVYLYNGTEKLYQDGHYAVVDIDIGTQDLQQCADAIIRLSAEYLYSKNEFDNIIFKLTNGDFIALRTWISGYRPAVRGNTITWHKHAPVDSSYNSFKDYLNFIFTYAGSYSLDQQLRGISELEDMEIGDIFIQGGFPGHAVMVVDMAINPETKEKLFLLCQSFMPAQDIHILKNLNEPSLSPWYKLNFDDTLYTPEWTFTNEDLKKF